MIRLKPNLEMLPRKCPYCQKILTAKGFTISGMRNLADLECTECNKQFYGDLPAGQGLYTAILLDCQSGEVFDKYNAGWFAEWLSESYKNRTEKPIKFDVRKFSAPKKKIILLNCLDVLYGHSLLKLLNAQHYLDCKKDFSLIVIIQPFLEWLVPEGIAEAWIVDLPLRDGTQWNDYLSAEIKERLESFDEVNLSVAFSHPHPEDFDIERFTKVSPFPLEDFGKHQNKPVITYIWRDDRLWENTQTQSKFAKLKRKAGISNSRIDEQKRKVAEFAEVMREEFPAVDFAVVGLGEAVGFPEWIADLRLTKLDAEAERKWCERYAKSHIVIGVHGSNMLLPSAHAAAVIELIDGERAGNFLQDILFRETDAREMFFRYRFVPLSTTPFELAKTVSIMLRFEDFRRLMSPEFCRHREEYDFEKYLT